MRPSILINHIGYEIGAPKRALIDAPQNSPLNTFEIVRDTGEVVHQGTLRFAGSVEGWVGRSYWTADFSSLDESGSFALRAFDTTSASFSVAQNLLLSKTAEAILDYFVSQHCKDQWDDADRQAPFFGARADRVDVHGGWYDASGDLSKYLSHLSYANFMNPQQTPIVVYNLLWAGELLAPLGDVEFVRKLGDEAAYGGDFLVRMQDPAGYFYMTVFDRWSKKLEEREICAYKTQQGIKQETYQAGYRQGAGATIAALAKLARSGYRGEYDSARYLDVARRGFDHLEAHNIEYLDDGQENIIDDYCALLAAAELFAATGELRYANAARLRAKNLTGRLTHDERHRSFFRADAGERPFFHAAEAGLPALALLRWSELTDSEAERTSLRESVSAALCFELDVTDEVNNPFGYARQYVKPLNGPKRSSFFFPHENESGYWWQGENARLGSLAAASALALTTGAVPDHRRERLLRYAYDQLDWILGRNPFDACMLHGFGRNNVDYLPAWPNVRGGIYNGITSGFVDENDIGFCSVSTPDQNWRWSEQWIPHAAWYLLAIAALGSHAP